MKIAGFVNLRLVGRGGFADVFVGTHVPSGQQRAVKVLREGHIAEFRENFAREVRILGARVSRYLLGVIEADLDAAQPHYVMPYMPAGPLTKRAGSLSDLDVLGYGSQIAHALSALHAIDVAHGDIKPDNALMVGNELRVSDPFGNGGGCTVTLASKKGGTPGYMAPELRPPRSEPISCEGDVYAFGATLFHLVTGVHPHRQPNLDPARIRPHVDPVLRAIVLDAVRPNSRERPPINAIHERLMKRHAELAPKVAAQREAVGTVLGVAAVTGLVVLLVKALSGK